MQAALREVKELRGASIFGLHLVGVHTIQETTNWFCTIGVGVGQWGTVILCVPAFTGGYAGMASDAGVQVDYKPEFLLGMGRKCSHDPTFCLTVSGALVTGLFCAG